MVRDKVRVRVYVLRFIPTAAAHTHMPLSPSNIPLEPPLIGNGSGQRHALLPRDAMLARH